MLTHLRCLSDMSITPCQVPRSIWARDGWAEGSALPKEPGPYRIRLRHKSGGLPPVELYAEWDGKGFGQLSIDPYSAVPGSAVVFVDSLLADFANADQWDVTAWVCNKGATGEQQAVT